LIAGNFGDQFANPTVTGMRVVALMPDQADIELFGQPWTTVMARAL
jgi:hypothetical protein